MRPFSSWGVTLAPAEMLTTFTSRPARRKSPSRCATYTPADEAVGTAAMTRWAISGPVEDPFIAAGPDAHPAVVIAASAPIAAAARGTHVRDNLDMGETISCRRECR